MTTLQKIRERVDKQASRYGGHWNRLLADRRHLLALIERCRPYIGHADECASHHGRLPNNCTCDLDALLKELGDG